jgi:5-methyltetrahydrofolate--homocysteine methyltransferase
MRAPILERLATGKPVIADGATGTMLQTAGLPPGLPGEAWVLDRPEEIRRLHQAYLDAGSELILTSTFGGTRPRLKPAGIEDQVAAISRRAAELARQAAGEDRYVGGDIGPTGQMMKPIGPLSHEEAVELFEEQAKALVAGGVDCLYIETMSDLNEAKAAMEAARRAGDLPVFCTFSFDTHGRTSYGVSPTQAAEAVAALELAGTGANCGHAPEELLDILPTMAQAAPGAYLVAKPNAGVPRMVKRQVTYDASPERMADLAVRYVALGARIVGTCCGSSPDHIAAIAAAVADEADG